MPNIAFTTEQLRAIKTSGQSVIVSAAAGSGKTAVLAERCAYLVCDAPADVRCNADELLVLTFTEAAASEMRTRIVAAIQEHASADPNNTRLREQAALVDSAQITTIHAFCLWLIRRWFTEVGIDPSASVMNADEANLLRRQVLDDLFQSLYARAANKDEPLLGLVRAPADEEGVSLRMPAMLPESLLADRFVRLVDDYGLSEDSPILEFILRVGGFLTSLPNPDDWLNEASAGVQENPMRLVASLCEELRQELSIQGEHCAATADELDSLGAPAAFHISLIRQYGQQLGEWERQLGPEYGPFDKSTFEKTRGQIASYTLSSKGGPRLPKNCDPKVRSDRDAASQAFSAIRRTMFMERLCRRHATLSADQWLETVRDTGPYVQTIVDVVRAFDVALGVRKRELNVLEFSDLETHAHKLLSDSDRPNEPSEIARTMHRRFAYVLVDEFQDVSPIQQTILRLVSRESDPDRADNLFVVGDVKQSIYRFRSAEPALFTARLEAFRGGKTGEPIDLQENFRSKPEVLDAVNLLFHSLMRSGIGGVAYDEASELRQGRRDEPDGGVHRPVDVHILDRTVDARALRNPSTHDGHADSDADDELDPDEPAARSARIDEPIAPDQNDPSKWGVIEREAHLIGRTIRAWRDSNEPIVKGRPPAFREIAVLLRVARYNADRVAAMLNAMGLPAYAAVGGSLFASLEVRDAVAALSLLDNPQQDIPLAAVMRSGILGLRFDEDELVAIRCHDRGVRFHEAVHSYGVDGSDEMLRNRVDEFLTRVERLRDEIRRRPLADVIRRILDDHGYMAYASGLPGGERRRANLLRLYDLARSFGSFHRQGLHRFLRFIESLDREGQEVSSAPAIGESENVIRVMSIHQAKGLEFPVVFVAGLGTDFNLGDRSGRMIFERQSHIGLRVVDPNRLIEYASAGHRLVSSEVERAARAEEMRILYVAMTRAEDRLVLVGTPKGRFAANHQSAHAAGETLTRHSICSARNALDWVLPILSAASPDKVEVVHEKAENGEELNDQSVYRLLFYHGDEIATWRLDVPDSSEHCELLCAAAAGSPLPSSEPVAPEDFEVERVRSRIERVYSRLAVTSVPATAAAGAFKGTHDSLVTSETAVATPVRNDPFLVPPSRYSGSKSDDAIARGLLTHRVLQHLDFQIALRASDLNVELERLIAGGVLKNDELSCIDGDALAWFLDTPLAQSIREAGRAFRREFHFIAREPPESLDVDAIGDKRDFVLVRGIVDGVWPDGDELQIVDYKTDRVESGNVTQHAERYRAQMWLYGRAVANMWSKNVRRATLVYLSARAMAVLDKPGRGAAPRSGLRSESDG